MSYDRDEVARLLVLADEHGRIIAAVRLPLPSPESVSGDDPAEVGIIPSNGQVMYEVLLPEELASAGKLVFLDDWYIEVDGDEAKLTKRSME